jgi:hypothetical protein
MFIFKKNNLYSEFRNSMNISDPIVRVVSFELCTENIALGIRPHPGDYCYLSTYQDKFKNKTIL